MITGSSQISYQLILDYTGKSTTFEVVSQLFLKS